MFDFNDLRAFTRIADLGSVSGAARALRMPKSSVSRSLARLEGELGAVLIERSTRHLRLTDAGLLFQRHAQRILDDIGEAENAVAGLSGKPQGDLRVSTTFTFAAGPLARILPDFQKSFPNVRVILSLDNRTVDLVTEEIDVAIRLGPLKDSELIARHLAVFELWPCASPSYLARHAVINSPHDLNGHKLITHAERIKTWVFRTAANEETKINITGGTVVPEPAIIKLLLIDGAGIGLLPDYLAIHAIADGTLIRILPNLSCGGIDAHALYPSHRSLSAKVRAFIDVLVFHLKQIHAR
jgi:DNA-binding transcriptional LysR family regulator